MKLGWLKMLRTNCLDPRCFHCLREKMQTTTSVQFHTGFGSRRIQSAIWNPKWFLRGINRRNGRFDMTHSEINSNNEQAASLLFLLPSFFDHHDSWVQHMDPGAKMERNERKNGRWMKIVIKVWVGCLAAPINGRRIISLKWKRREGKGNSRGDFQRSDPISRNKRMCHSLLEI